MVFHRYIYLLNDNLTKFAILKCDNCFLLTPNLQNHENA